MRGVGVKPWQGGNRIGVRARLYDYTSCPDFWGVLTVNGRQKHDGAVERENHEIWQKSRLARLAEE